MSNYNQPQAAYPPAGMAYPAEPQGGYMAAPPPVTGFPVKDGEVPPANTQSRGDGFWRGWSVHFSGINCRK
ncbi:hypothetical protein C2S51_037017 [Perilla frutescens var. frutescens]|nr:hypothetical protein C2S51_037017 [Perilla frutescens var. frutescens]